MKFHKNVVMACAESFFTMYGKTFSSSVSNRITDLLQCHETVLGYWVHKFIGCAISSDSAVRYYRASLFVFKSDYSVSLGA